MKLDFETASEVDKAFTKGPLCEAYLELQDAYNAKLAEVPAEAPAGLALRGRALGVVDMVARQFGLTQQEAVDAVLAVAVRLRERARGPADFFEEIKAAYPPVR